MPLEQVDPEVKESATEDDDGRLVTDDGKYICKVDECFAVGESEKSMRAHSSPAHGGQHAWETGRDYEGDKDRSGESGDRSDTASSGSGQSGGAAFARSYERPVDILEKVLLGDPDLDPDDVDWILESKEYQKTISPSNLYEIMMDYGINDGVVRRVKKRYIEACNTALQQDPYLQYEDEWALWLQKETGQDYVSRAREMRQSGQLPARGGAGGIAVPPTQPQQQGGQQPQVQQPGQPQGGQSRSDSPSVQPPGPPPQLGGSNVQQQGGQQQSGGPDYETERRFQELQRQQREMLEMIERNMNEDEGDATKTLEEQIEQVNAINEKMQRLAQDNGGDDELRREIETMKESIRNQMANDSDANPDDLTGLVELAAREDTDIAVEDVSTFADAMGVTDPAVKEKEMDIKLAEMKMDRRRQMFSDLSGAVGNMNMKAVGKMLGKLKEGLAESSEPQQNAQPRQPTHPQQVGHQQPQPQPGVQTSQPQGQPQQPQGQPQQQPQQPQGQPQQQGGQRNYRSPGGIQPSKQQREQQSQSPNRTVDQTSPQERQPQQRGGGGDVGGAERSSMGPPEPSTPDPDPEPEPEPEQDDGPERTTTFRGPGPSEQGDDDDTPAVEGGVEEASVPDAPVEGGVGGPEPESESEPGPEPEVDPEEAVEGALEDAAEWEEGADDD